MHNGTDGWHWGFGFGHWGFGVIFWLAVIFIVVFAIKGLIGKS